MDVWKSFLNGESLTEGIALKYRGNTNSADVTKLTGNGFWYTSSASVNSRPWSFIVIFDTGGDGVMLEYSISSLSFRMRFKNSGVWQDWIEK